MCGITGIVSPKTRKSKYQQRLKKMVAALAHRGPDAQTTQIFNGCGLGHARLSIVDLATGGQPMLDASGRLALVFNGELYGYKHLRQQLDYPFRTESDSELILALYDAHGESLTKHLPGMFAFALWDEAQEQLVCGRDRFGEKPFYYAIGTDGSLVFGSEIKSLLASGLLVPKINLKAVAHYLKYLYVPVEATIYENICTLPPAHTLVYRKGKVTISRYWQLPDVTSQLSLEDAVEQLTFLLDKSVQQQLIADVPVGAFLSGGLDSTTIVALGSKHKPDLMTLAFGFDGQASELPFASEAARRYGTNHVELTEEQLDVTELLKTMNQVYDEPFADSSNIPTYLLSKQARRYLKVVLTGDGGDELLGGYSWYLPLYMMEWLERYPKAMRPLVAALVAQVAPRLGARVGSYALTGLKGLQANQSVGQAYADKRAYFSPTEMTKLLGSRLKAKNGTGLEKLVFLDDVIRHDVVDYMPGDILAKTDRASMAHGLELRAPFLDVDVASLCLSLPYQLKLSTWTDKVLLRRAFADNWPASIRRRQKQGFGAPVGRWLTLPSVRELVEEYLGDRHKRVFDLIDFDTVQLFKQMNNYQCWTLLVLSLWAEHHDWS